MKDPKDLDTQDLIKPRNLRELRGEDWISPKHQYHSSKGKSLEQGRDIVEHRCGYCGKAYLAIRISKFCSNKCRQANKRLKAWKKANALGA